MENRVSEILASSYSPSGNPDAVETGASQLANEIELEEVFEKYVAEHGFTSTGMELLFKLFDVLIGNYRLEKCEFLLGRIRDSAGYETRIDQAWAFTKWKQGKWKEAMEFFKKMEQNFFQKNEANVLFQNMAHTYSSMGELALAEEYFSKCTVDGGVLLGLGLLKQRQGNVPAGIELCLEALEWYASRFSRATGNPSSLEAKCASSLARMYLEQRDFKNALTYANVALSIFNTTCDPVSPLIGSALRLKAEVLRKLNAPLEAIEFFIDAFRIEAIKDGFNLVTLIEIQQSISATFSEIPSPRSPSHIKPAFKIAIAACERANLKLNKDGNLGAFYKLMGEFGILAEEYSESIRLLEAAIPLLQHEHTMDCSNLVAQCVNLVSLLDKKLKTS